MTKVSKKHETIIAWSALSDSNPSESVQPIPYKASGSKYGTCGIRIDGNSEFVDAVLSKLKDMLICENGMTRLELARRQVESVTDFGKGRKKTFAYADNDSEVCYIRVHERGPESQTTGGSKTLPWLASNPKACMALGIDHAKAIGALAKMSA